MSDMELMGYGSRVSVGPGETIDFKVSAEAAFDAEIVRLGGVGPDGLVREDAVAVPGLGRHPGRRQDIRTGSFISVATERGPGFSTFGFELWIFPTLTDRDRQTVLSVRSVSGRADWRLDLTPAGLSLTAGDRVVTADAAGLKDRWVHVWGGRGADGLALGFMADGRWPAERQSGSAVLAVPEAPVVDAIAGVTIAAGTDEHGLHRHCFNGRVENPRVFAKPIGEEERKVLAVGAGPPALAGNPALAAWDFGLDIGARTVTDTSPNRLHGVLVNRPTRGVRSHAWSGGHLRFREKPAEWAAIHFHDDDLDDAGWETSFSFVVPQDLPSGIYAARLSHAGAIDHVPFYVRPATASANEVLFLAPTNTYLAYANEHLGFGERGVAHEKRMREAIRLNETDRYVHSHPELGLSIYDRHADGSGVCHSSWRRPVLNFRPNYITWLNASRRHFAADFYITGWLEKQGRDFDVATDEDLHREGAALLSRYRTVVTGSHPEYPTSREMAALHEYVGSGGRIMYLGGNGFYWVTSYDGDELMTIECRRGYAGERNWTSHPAELDHSSTGEIGGLYTHRGQSARLLFGVTSVGVGWGTASGYTRTEDSHSPDLAFLFEGIESPVIGDFGHMLGGAAGDELDAADFAAGTPANARILMSSRHDETYYPFLETVTQVEPNVSGPHNPNVRSDVVYIDTGAGGRVFSAGSICWAGAMAFNDYDNNVSRLCANVLKSFLAD
jgi:N,N-dimethylformamidase